MVALLEADEVAERSRAASKKKKKKKARFNCRAEHVIQENERLGDDSLSDRYPNSISTKRRDNDRTNQYTPLSAISPKREKKKKPQNIMLKTRNSGTRSRVKKKPL